MIRIIRNSGFCSKLVIVFAIVISFLLAPIAFAGQTGTEGGSFIPSDYEITAGGSVTMFLYQSPDVVIIGDQGPVTQTMTGQTTGSYPTSANFPGMYLAQGSFALDRISISPASGYSIDDLIIGGTSQGAITTYDFAGTGPFTFTVRFKQNVATTTTEQPTTKTTTEEPKATTKNTAPATVAVTTPAATESAEVAATSTEETAAVEPVTAEPVSAAPKSSTFPYWWILLIILILLLLFLFFLLWKRRKKDENDKDENDKKHNKK